MTSNYRRSDLLVPALKRQRKKSGKEVGTHYTWWRCCFTLDIKSNNNKFWWQAITGEITRRFPLSKDKEKGVGSKLEHTILNKECDLSLDICEKNKTDDKQFTGGINLWFPLWKGKTKKSKLKHTIPDESVCLSIYIKKPRWQAVHWGNNSLVPALKSQRKRSDKQVGAHYTWWRFCLTLDIKKIINDDKQFTWEITRWFPRWKGKTRESKLKHTVVNERCCLPIDA